MLPWSQTHCSKTQGNTISRGLASQSPDLNVIETVGSFWQPTSKERGKLIKGRKAVFCSVYFCCSVGHFNTGDYEDWLTVRVTLKCPLEEMPLIYIVIKAFFPTVITIKHALHKNYTINVGKLHPNSWVCVVKCNVFLLVFSLQQSRTSCCCWPPAMVQLTCFQPSCHYTHTHTHTHVNTHTHINTHCGLYSLIVFLIFSLANLKKNMDGICSALDQM